MQHPKPQAPDAAEIIRPHFDEDERDAHWVLGLARDIAEALAAAESRGRAEGAAEERRRIAERCVALAQKRCLMLGQHRDDYDNGRERGAVDALRVLAVELRGAHETKEGA